MQDRRPATTSFSTSLAQIARGEATLDRSAWRWISVACALLAAGCAALLGWILGEGSILASVAGGILGGIIVGPLVLLLGFTHLKLNEIMTEVRVSLREMINIRPLVDGPPLDYGYPAMDPHLGKVLAQVVARHRPDYVVEIGSGTSTVFTAHLLDTHNPSGRVTAVEHLEKYAQRSQQLIQDHACESFAEVVTAPLRKRAVEAKEVLWYDLSPADLETRPIDFLFVDGPPGDVQTMARYPAVPLLKPHLADDCVIVLDDGDRPDERETAHRWAEMLNAELEYAGGPKGSYILRC